MSSRFRNNALSGRLSNLSSNEINQHTSQVDSSKVLLSGCTDGQPILINPTSVGSSVTVHQSHATALDEVWLYAANIDTSVDRTLHLSFDGGSSTDVSITIPDNTGLVLVLPGFMVTNEVTVSAYASSADKINLFGWVNRYFTLEQRSLQGEGWSAGND